LRESARAWLIGAAMDIVSSVRSIRFKNEEVRELIQLPFG
jgi:hypothetical protein